MIFTRPPQQRSRRLFLIGATTALSFLASNAFALEAVEVTGINTDHGTRGIGEDAKYLVRSKVCMPNAEFLVMETMENLRSRIDPRLIGIASGAGMPMPDAGDAAKVFEKLCIDDEDDFSSDIFTIFYTECRMTMDSAGQMLDIVLPVNGADGRMDVADFLNQEVIRVFLKPVLEKTAQVVGRGWSDNVSMTPQGSGGEIAGYPTTKYQFSYSGGLGGAGTAVPMAGEISTTSSGTSWVAEKVDGIEIIQAFYENMSSEVDASQGSGSFMSGLISNLVGMLGQGVPMKMDQLVESRLSGASIMSGRTEMEVYSVNRVPLPNDWCERNFIPDGFQIRDINEEISGAMAGAGMDEETAAAMSEAQQQYQEAMKSLTPEQRQMMENMGLGNMQQMMGGAAPAAAAAPAATASQSQPRSSANESADPYYSDNVTQMVQRQLEALGYDPGNTDGVESLETTIAISQFQAENNMAVTGKASPQMAGILSARLGGN